MILNITLEDKDSLKFYAANQYGEIIEISVTFDEYADALRFESSNDKPIDFATLGLSEEGIE